MSVLVAWRCGWLVSWPLAFAPAWSMFVQFATTAATLPVLVVVMGEVAFGVMVGACSLERRLDSSANLSALRARAGGR